MRKPIGYFFGWRTTVYYWVAWAVTFAAMLEDIHNDMVEEGLVRAYFGFIKRVYTNPVMWTIGLLGAILGLVFIKKDLEDPKNYHSL